MRRRLLEQQALQAVLLAVALTTNDDDGSGRAPASYGSESDGAKDMYVTGVSARAGEVARRGSVKTFSRDLFSCLKSSAAVAAAK